MLPSCLVWSLKVKNGSALSSPLFHTLTDAPTPSSAGIFAPQLASTTMGFGFLSSMGFLYNRYFPPLSPQRLAIALAPKSLFSRISTVSHDVARPCSA
jgi:hypothetical protein